jgi:hypothetical protein
MLIGWVSDKAGLDKALLLLPIFGLFASALLFLGAKGYVRDLERARKVTLVEE